MEKAKESRIGEVIDGRYIILEQLGEGAAGTVYRAEDCSENHAFVALKILHAKDPRWEGFFRREFELLASFKHPNIVGVNDFGQLSGDSEFYFTQELVVGRPLLEAVSGHAVADVLRLFAELCHALEFIHGHEVLHRDLKPANILVSSSHDEGYRVKLLDFGLWRAFETKPVRGARWAGTPPYLATEVLRGFGHSVEADLYAVGVTLYQALTRRLPHGRGTPQELIERRRKEEVVFPDHISEDLRVLVADMINEDKSQRPASASIVAARLSALAGVAETPSFKLGQTMPVGFESYVTTFEEQLDLVMASSDVGPIHIDITGGEGTGKTRLAELLKTKAQLRGARVGLVDASERRWARGRVAFELSKSLLPHWFYRAHVHDRPEYQDSSVSLRTEQEPEKRTGIFSLDMASMSDNLLEARRRLLKNSQKRLTVIVIDRIDQADSLSQDFIFDLMRRAQGTNLVLVTTRTRHDGETSAVHQHMRPDFEWHLRPFSKEHIQQLCSRLLAIETVPPKWLEGIEDISNGTPALIAAYIQYMIRDRLLERTIEGWRFDDMPGWLPSMSTDVIRLRIEERSGHAQNLVFALAMLKQQCHVSLLCAVLERDVDDVLNDMADLEQQDLLVVEEQLVRLASGHIQRVAASMSIESKRHLRSAFQMTSVLSQRDMAKTVDGALMIAELFRVARQPDKSLMWSLKALKGCMRINDIDRAEMLMKKIQIDLTYVEVGSALFVRTMIRLGEYYSILGHVEQAFDHLFAATEHMQQCFDELPRGQLEHCWDRLMVLGKTIGRLEDTKQAYRAWLLRYNIRDDLFTNPNLYLESDPARALNTVQSSSYNARDLGFLERIHAQFMKGQAMWYVGESEAAYWHVRQLRQYVGQHNDILMGELLRFEAHVASTLGKRLIARKRLMEAKAYADRSKIVVEHVLCDYAIMQELMKSGALERALQMGKEVITRFARSGRRYERVHTMALIGEMLQGQGEYKQSRRHLQYACLSADRLRDPILRIAVRCALLENALAMNEVDEAQMRWHELSALCHGHTPLRLLPRIGRCGARLSLSIGQIGQARQYAIRALQLSRRLSSVYDEASGFELLSHVHVKRDRIALAHQHADKAKNMFMRFDAVLDVRRVRPIERATRSYREMNI